MLKRYRLDIYSPSIIDRVNIVNKESTFIHKEACEIIQRIGKIEEIQVMDGERDSYCNSESNHRIKLLIVFIRCQI